MKIWKLTVIYDARAVAKGKKTAETYDVHSYVADAITVLNEMANIFVFKDMRDVLHVIPYRNILSIFVREVEVL